MTPGRVLKPLMPISDFAKRGGPRPMDFTVNRPNPLMDNLDQTLRESADKPKRKNRTAKSGGKSSGNDFYLTPHELLAEISRMGAIELDPAGSDAGSYVYPEREYLLSRGEDGLVLPWKTKMGALTFCNNPYSETRKWVEKADAEYAKWRGEIILLVAARPDTIAWQKSTARLVCFLGGRLKFHDPETHAPPKDAKGKDCGAMFPSAILYWGMRERRFREVFGSLGRVARWTEPTLVRDVEPCNPE